jgi:hypothetical protein
LATEFESVSNSLGGARPSLNWMAAFDKNLDAAIWARFSGSGSFYIVDVLFTIFPSSLYQTTSHHDGIHFTDLGQTACKLGTRSGSLQQA